MKLVLTALMLFLSLALIGCGHVKRDEWKNSLIEQGLANKELKKELADVKSNVAKIDENVDTIQKDIEGLSDLMRNTNKPATGAAQAPPANGQWLNMTVDGMAVRMQVGYTPGVPTSWQQCFALLAQRMSGQRPSLSPVTQVNRMYYSQVLELLQEAEDFKSRLNKKEENDFQNKIIKLLKSNNKTQGDLMKEIRAMRIELNSLKRQRVPSKKPKPSDKKTVSLQKRLSRPYYVSQWQWNTRSRQLPYGIEAMNALEGEKIRRRDTRSYYGVRKYQ